MIENVNFGWVSFKHGKWIACLSSIHTWFVILFGFQDKWKWWWISNLFWKWNKNADTLTNEFVTHKMRVHFILVLTYFYAHADVTNNSVDPNQFERKDIEINRKKTKTKNLLPLTSYVLRLNLALMVDQNWEHGPKMKSKTRNDDNVDNSAKNAANQIDKIVDWFCLFFVRLTLKLNISQIDNAWNAICVRVWTVGCVFLCVYWGLRCFRKVFNFVTQSFESIELVCVDVHWREPQDSFWQHFAINFLRFFLFLLLLILFLSVSSTIADIIRLPIDRLPILWLFCVDLTFWRFDCVDTDSTRQMASTSIVPKNKRFFFLLFIVRKRRLSCVVCVAAIRCRAIE